MKLFFEREPSKSVLNSKVVFNLNTTGVVAYQVFLHTKGQFVHENYGSKYGNAVIYLPGQLARQKM